MSVLSATRLPALSYAGRSACLEPAVSHRACTSALVPPSPAARPRARDGRKQISAAPSHAGRACCVTGVFGADLFAFHVGRGVKENVVLPLARHYEAVDLAVTIHDEAFDGACNFG